jgi:N-succinyldiaminopimelate aminotransferase
LRGRALATALFALCEPGDDVVTSDLWYDGYAARAAMAGAHPTARAGYFM